MAYIIFILGIALINVSLFLPNYLINKNESTFFPDLTRISSFKEKGLWMDYNLDPFRISIDMMLIIFTAYLLKIEIFVILVPAYFVIIQLFNLYHCSFRKIYQTHPAIINDLKLLFTGLSLLLAEMRVKFVLMVLLGFFFLGMMALMVHFYVQFLIEMNNHLFITVSGTLFFLVYLIKGFNEGFYNQIYDQVYRFNFFPLRIVHNVKLSLKMVESKKLLANRLSSNESFRALTLREKPNIHFICIESYGSILMKNQELKHRFIPIFENCMSNLSGLGYETTSNFSESVSLVGPSWLAYTTILLGTRVESNFEYEYLLANEASRYEALPKSLQKNGYISYNLNPIKPRTGISVPYLQMKNLYGIDKFILYDDMPYLGTRYGISETPPEQYVLNFTREEVLKNSLQPYFLFYLTKNSHSPFISPKDIRKNWKSWNNGTKELIGNKFLKIPTHKDYLTAINYQLESLYDYIKGFKHDNNVFVLIGDHQPHHIVHSDDYGLETLVHIISKNKEFINSFKKHGFSSIIGKHSKQIKHESLREIIENELQRIYN